MPDKRIIQIQVPVNRAEGDLEISVNIEDGIVIDAWSSGTMYRGFENILKGRAPLDSLVITPRICGICSTAHLTVACKALDMITGIQPPPDAVRIRNIALMVENIQSDVRHAFLSFMPDFTNPAYSKSDFFEEAVRRFEPFKGNTVLDVIRETKKLIGIVAIIGGQWPHSSFMVPGGIVSMPSTQDLTQCHFILKQFRVWYESSVLGCSVERWQAVKSESDLSAWLNEKETHKHSLLGFYLRTAHSAGLDKIGQGHDNFISFGAYDMPEDSDVEPPGSTDQYLPAGFAKHTKIFSFDEAKIKEHLSHSWFIADTNSRHPSDSKTQPDSSFIKGNQYSWVKAPRYDGLPAETGPLAEMIVSENPLFTDYVNQNGSNVFIRELARLVRPALLMPVMKKWILETSEKGSFYTSAGKIRDGEGFGLINVTRGALGHWVRIKDGLIDNYQIITPTSWNGCPRDDNSVRGPWEEALVGTPVQDTSNPIELGHVVRSFDACLVCAVHSIDLNKKKPHPPMSLLV